ncbi:MAG: DNA repair protein RadC [Firmicutes bacterium]|jgi:DNA repair protein RadC|nr:DNA repair protein RadC [Bacillota bacterium]MCR4709481.1 DNA repair protein RadC [Clostridiales bacterium]
MKIKNLPPEERPIEKLLAHGKESLSNSELLAVILGSGFGDMSAIELAENILALKDGIRGLTELSPDDLMKIPGIGPRKAASVISALELGRRVSTAPRSKKYRVKSPDNMAEYFMEDMRYLKKEFFKVLLLNVKLEVIGLETVSVGELAGAPVHPRESFEPAIRKGAAAVCFVHNHPSGDPHPSKDDLEITKRLTECGDILGIRVLDHIIIGDGVYTSLKEEGYII